MKTNHLFLVLCLAIAAVSCKKDTLKDIDEGTRSDRNITEVKFENQIGISKIERREDHGEITFSYNLDATGSMQIKLVSLVASVGASVPVGTGDVIDFDNADHSSVVTVTSRDGQVFDWIIRMVPFTEPLKGVWKIESMWLYGGVDRGEWGGAGFKSFEGIINTLFKGDNLPEHELDNTYTFTVDGFSSNGNAYGTITNDAGPDGKYGEYKYGGEDADGKIMDCGRIYRKIPTVAGMWEHDTSLDIYYFRDNTGALLATGTMKREAFTYQYGPKSGTQEFPANTLLFDVTALGLDPNNWGKNYTTVGIVACDPLAYLISLKK